MSRHSSPQFLFWSSLVLLALAVGGIAVYIFWPADTRDLVSSQLASPLSLTEARNALSRNNFAEAEKLARQVYVANPGEAEALLIAAKAALRTGRPGDALAYLRLVPDRSPVTAEARTITGELLLRMGRISEAEQMLRQALALDADYLIAHRHLGILLSVSGRRWESLPHLFEVIRSGEYTHTELAIFSDSEKAVNDRQLLDYAIEQAPEDPLPHVGIARVEMEVGHTKEARQHIRRALELSPGLLEAWAIYGQLLLTDRDFSELRVWQGKLPKSAEKHPDVWYVRGAWCEQQNQLPQAIRCYAEAARLNPLHARANYRLSQLLAAALGEEQASAFVKWSDQLQQLRQSLDVTYEEGPLRPYLVKLSTITEQMHRPWDAWAWSKELSSRYPDEPGVEERLARVNELVQNNPPRLIFERTPIASLDIRQFPLPEWGKAAPAPPTTPTPRPQLPLAKSTPRFEDVAQAVGLQFQTFNDDDPNMLGIPIYKQMTGGIAVIDYDVDGWPDIYFSQGSVWPFDPQKATHHDQLFRNLGNGRFEDVTQRAGLGDRSFSQGVTVGDFNNDGYPDLYVANIGRNRLYRNEGDGTFRDVTDESELTSELWTTSCLIADLNGDQLPDLYDVNYLAGPEPYETVCQENGRPGPCRPQHFRAEQDQLLLNLGDGRFQEISQEAGIVDKDGKGLGVLAADFTGNGKLNLFVANDTTPNFYFVNETASPGDRPRFEDRAFLTGLAVDRDGKPQACMGIGLSDADEDGLFDLFVTNFENEHFTLYLQQPGHYFADLTREAGLEQATRPLLGFGTQFLDAEWDGRPDLVIANGHVSDARDRGKEYQMRPQFFRNIGGGRFEELFGEQLGPYFQGKYLGRSLVLIDWNRDGKQDFLVHHLDAPAALLTNSTAETGHHLQIRLHGVQSARDAIGTTLVAQVGERKLARQLTAGDGYEGANERQVSFGLGDAAQIDTLEVRWPSGLKQTFHNVPADQEIVLVEGRDEYLPLLTTSVSLQNK